MGKWFREFIDENWFSATGSMSVWNRVKSLTVVLTGHALVKVREFFQVCWFVPVRAPL